MLLAGGEFSPRPFDKYGDCEIFEAWIRLNFTLKPNQALRGFMVSVLSNVFFVHFCNEDTFVLE